MNFSFATSPQETQRLSMSRVKAKSKMHGELPSCIGIVPFQNMLVGQIQKVDMVQRRAARFVNGNYKKSEGTVTGVLTKMNWQTLEQRRKNARLTTMFMIHNQDIAVPIPVYTKTYGFSNSSISCFKVPCNVIAFECI